ncbi:hypothetical protein ACO229_12805 [Promicromonospora sp. MS192]|uniref:hypothetical protein n=1 Tax=Promicromonospora sp. MS192 TaxID=3412684 RepID=UPI003C2EE847
MLRSQVVHAVILPATPLLVAGLVPGLSPDPLAAVRAAVAGALAELTSGGLLPLVVAHGPALRRGRMQPSLAGSGIGDRWLPPGPGGTFRADDALPPAGTGASVALLALRDVLGADVAVETLEVPAAADAPDGGTAEALRTAPGLVVAGGTVPGGTAGRAAPGGGAPGDPAALTPGLRTALRLAGADTWTPAVRRFPQAHDHLPSAYVLTTFS